MLSRPTVTCSPPTKLMRCLPPSRIARPPAPGSPGQLGILPGANSGNLLEAWGSPGLPPQIRRDHPEQAPGRCDPGAMLVLQDTGRELQGAPSAINPHLTSLSSTKCVAADVCPQGNMPNRAILSIEIWWGWDCPRGAPTEHACQSRTPESSA